MTTPVGTILFGGLIAWGIYRRVRRNIGRQPLRPRRLIVSLVVFSLVSVLLFSLSLPFPKMLLGIGGGILLGALLGFVGLRLTKFETTEQGHFYTPNTHIGVALSLLFVGRMLYRIWLVGGPSPAPGQPQLFQSPLTLFIFGLIAGYYLVYYIGLFVHTHDRK
jgi:NhaP-type Na+/H+ or K+/H+ antiporter